MARSRAVMNASVTGGIVSVPALLPSNAGALTIAWDAFCGAARDDITGWEVAAAAAQVQPEPSLARASNHTERRSSPPTWARRQPAARPVRRSPVL
jgi:hypothetical protein